jgi:predicted nucleotidyltransferase
MRVRLSDEDITIIKKSIHKYIPNQKIILFGSRSDLNKKGGDIDIFIKPNYEITFETKLKILTNLEKNGITRKVDLIIQNPNDEEKLIFQEAKKGVVL